MQRISTATAVQSKPAPSGQGTPGYFTNGNAATGLPGTVIDQDFLNGIQEAIAHPIEATGQELNASDDTLLTAAIRKLGLIAAYDAAFAAKVGGYTAKSIVADPTAIGIYWISTADNNLTTPGSPGASWVSLFQGLTSTPIAVSGSGPIALSYLYLLGSTGLLWANTFSSAGAATSKQIITADQYKTTINDAGGYRVAPDGFITQWGTATLPTSSTSTSDVITSYPIPFPSKCISVKPVALDYANNTQGCWPSLSLYGAPGQTACHIIGDTLSHQASVSTPFDRTVAVQWVAEGF